ncbi:hypothetical protein [Streptomyces griseofuscus]|nr:hypothetical protein [Streptomyces griseofuscus]
MSSETTNTTSSVMPTSPQHTSVVRALVRATATDEGQRGNVCA